MMGMEAVPSTCIMVVTGKGEKLVLAACMAKRHLLKECPALTGLRTQFTQLIAHGFIKGILMSAAANIAAASMKMDQAKP